MSLYRTFFATKNLIAGYWLFIAYYNSIGIKKKWKWNLMILNFRWFVLAVKAVRWCLRIYFQCSKFNSFVSFQWDMGHLCCMPCMLQSRGGFVKISLMKFIFNLFSRWITSFHKYTQNGRDCHAIISDTTTNTLICRSSLIDVSVDSWRILFLHNF